MAMQHETKDAHAANVRALSSYAPQWHPILAAVELEPGTWVMTAQYERRYAIIRLLRIGGEAGYRVVTWAERSEDRRLVGYYRSLRAAAEAAHARYLEDHAQQGGINER